MERPHSYSYPFTTAGTSRYASNHASSSAFSASANPNEDWTKISDLAERRRIQNRIAQRNYRKKLKRRLEDLERRAASSSASPEQSHQELASNASEDGEKIQPPAQLQRSSKNGPQHAERRMSPEPLSIEDRSSLFGQQITRQLSASPPPTFCFAAYPPTDNSFYTGYQQNNSYSTIPSSYDNYTYSNQYYSSLPPTLPPMVPSNGFKREQVFVEDDMLTPFSMTYASMAGIEVPTTQSHLGHTAHTPPLTDPFSLDDSRESSPSNLAFPATPTSLSASPTLPDYSIFCT